MVPTTLNDWTEESIRRLLEAGVFEGEEFDWKEKLPHSRGEVDKDRLRKVCAAFANARGGFLVYGVADSRSNMPPTERVVGIDPGEDFYAKFGEFPGSCRPAVPWEKRTTPICLVSGRLIHVIEIPRSRVGPHAITSDSSKDNATQFVFPKRTNKGVEFMNYDEVRMHFFAYHDRFTQLNVLRLELASIRDDMKIVQERFRPDEKAHPVIEVGEALLERMIADCYVLLARDPEILQGLMVVRRRAREFNNVQQHAFGVYRSQPESGQCKLVKDLARTTAADLERQCEYLIPRLDAFLRAEGFTVPSLPPLDPRELNRSSWSGALLLPVV